VPPPPALGSRESVAVPFVGIGARGISVGSDSMRPNLWRGDVIAGYEWAGPLDESLRGRAILFDRPRATATQSISRVIGLPGERIQLRGGQVHIDGRGVPRERIEDALVAGRDGGPESSYPQYVETLPSGRRYRIVQILPSAPLNDTAEFIVPADHVFVLSDNRDNAIDSRLPDLMGPVPVASIRGVVTGVVVSYDPDVSVLQRGAIALFLAAPPSWYPPRTVEQWRIAQEWRDSAPLAGSLRFERSQLLLDQF
jgi:signal peptidase I